MLLEDNYNHDLLEEEVVLEPHFSRDGMLSNVLTLSTAECNNSAQIPSLAPEIGSGGPTSKGGEDELREQLRFWVVRHNITHAALKELLKILKQHPNLSNFPSDPRTLLGTRPARAASSASEICGIAGGHYYHFGLSNGLQDCFQHAQNLPSMLSLSFNIDGLPISKSSKMQLWPIQCMVNNYGKLAPLAVGIFAGTQKPKSANEFLRPFVDELKVAINDGVHINGRTVGVTFKAIICDAPARTFVLCTKGHNAFSGCPKCTVYGESLSNRTVFLDAAAPCRTDESFRGQFDDDHHKRTTILTELLIDMVMSSPLHYMHLVCLRVV